tara:strand:- start:670 stop:1083 length:414 start_codon:yes stop_codon:yes gene_type:complete
MGIEAGIYSALTGSTSLTGIVGTRIYPQIVPQGADYPNVRFSLLADEVINSSTGHTTLRTATVTVDCYSLNSYSQTIDIAEAVTAVLNTNSTTFGSIQIESGHVSGAGDEAPVQPSDGSDDYIYGRSIDVDLFYYST